MRTRAILLGLGASVLVACQPTTFSTTVTGQTTVRGDPLGALFSAFPPVGSFANLDFSANQDFKNEGVSKKQVTSVKATEVKLKILSPNDQDFRFLESLAFYARTGDHEVLVADKVDIARLDLSAPNPTLKMDVKGAELQPYVTAPSMTIVVRGRGRSPPQDTRLEASVTLLVEFKLLPGL